MNKQRTPRKQKKERHKEYNRIFERFIENYFQEMRLKEKEEWQ